MQEVIQVKKEEALKTLNEVDEVLAKSESAIKQASSCFIDLSFLLLKVKRGAYWTERGFNSEHEYIEKVFPQSRAQYYKFIRYGTHLGKYNREKLKEWGQFKCEDLVRLHVHFDGEVPKEWITYLDTDDRETFRNRVREYLDTKEQGQISGDTGTEKQDKTEPSEPDATYITLKIYGGGIHTVNLAADVMGKIIGSEKSLGYRIELICANFNSQFADDGTGHVAGKNSYILSTIEGLVKQLDLKAKDASEMLIGIVAKGVEGNVAT